MRSLVVTAPPHNETRAVTLVDQARKSWRFEIAYESVMRVWTVRSLDEGWSRTIYLAQVGFPTARNIAIRAVFMVDNE